MIKIAPSILSANFAAMGDAVLHLKEQGADWIHFDVMDGNFVPNITFGPDMCKALRPLTDLPIDVHLMVEHPSDWIEPFKAAGADILTIHVESSERHLHRALQAIHAAGMKAGVVLNPATPIFCAFICSCSMKYEMLPRKKYSSNATKEPPNCRNFASIFGLSCSTSNVPP